MFRTHPLLCTVLTITALVGLSGSARAQFRNAYIYDEPRFYLGYPGGYYSADAVFYAGGYGICRPGYNLYSAGHSFYSGGFNSYALGYCYWGLNSYSGGYGSVAPHGWNCSPGFLFSVAAAPTSAAPVGQVLKIARLNVVVPDAEARVTLAGQELKKSGATRTFETPLLAAGKTHGYTVNASWTKNGEEVTETRRVEVAAGGDVLVDFTRPRGADRIVAAK